MSRRGKPVAFQFYAGDWLSDPHVQALPLDAKGAYIHLLAYCSQAEGYGLPVEPEDLRRLVGADSEEWTAIWARLERFWPEKDGLRRNPKLTSVLGERDAYFAGQVRKGKLGAKARWDGRGNGPAMAQPSPGHWPNDGSPSPSPSPTPTPPPEEKKTREARPMSKADRRKWAGKLGGSMWNTWLDHLFERTNPSKGAIQAQLAKLEKLTDPQASFLIQEAISSNAQGFPAWAVEKAKTGQPGKTGDWLSQLTIVPNKETT